MKLKTCKMMFLLVNIYKFALDIYNNFVDFISIKNILAISKKGLKNNYNSLHEADDLTNYNHKQRILQ